MKFTENDLFWIREPKKFIIDNEQITIYSKEHTDLWQRTYYGFQNDNAPVLQMKTDERYFSFVVKTEFNTQCRFDQCGVIIYLDSENWIKSSIEYENEEYQRLGSVVTNQGYSDWATTDIPSTITHMWYRLSRRESDYCIEYSEDGENFKQMRFCHLHHGDHEISFGIYACSPGASSFKATFTHMEITDCKWQKHQ